MLNSSSLANNQYFLDELGVRWYLDFGKDTSQVPAGVNKVPFIGEISLSTLLSTTTIASLVQAAPAGSYWYVGGEPNDPVKEVTPTEFADVFRYYHTEITANDPTARVLSPSLLNWWFTCFSCGGYQSGRDWADGFINAYESKYGVKPPVAAWSIDLYPLDWRGWLERLSGRDPSPFLPNDNWQLVRDQITGGTWPIVKSAGRFFNGAPTTYEGMRAYLDSRGYEDTPIWITELAVHWGYDDIVPVFDANDQALPPEPAGSYKWDALAGFVLDIVDWLEANADAYQIERWFLFTTWKNIAEPAKDAYGGIILFGSEQDTQPPQAGVTPLNCLGRVYRALTLNQSRVTCDAAGGVIPAP